MTNVTVPTAAAAALFAALVDDAALFPPREATMADALRAHATHRAGPNGWIQGPFVMPAHRLRELLAVRREIAGGPLRLSLVVDHAGFDASIADAADALGDASARDIAVAMVELRLSSAEVPVAELRRVCELVRALGADDEPPALFLESARMPTSRDEPALLASIVAAPRDGVSLEVGAKLRTGGVTRDAVPASARVARFIAAMRDRDVRWKATAGLHHPVRGVHGGQTMHGFLNVLAATIGAQTGALDADRLVAVLDETDPVAFRLAETAFGWRGVTFDLAAITAARRTALRSFGSCSFDEPVDGLRALGMLP